MKYSKFLITMMLVACGLQLGTIFAQIPDTYKPNAPIQEKYDKIVNELFVEIQSKSQIGQQISPTVFAELYTLFDDIIPYLPNTYSFNIIYQQCLSLSETLAGGYNLNTLASFMDNCFKPFIKTVEEINKDYTIKAVGTISPSTGPAPLSVTLDARTSSDPSNQTIPNNNFYRYYRDINGVDKTIGVGNVLNYTFEEPGNYTVHLTVRSSNQSTQGIVDGSQIFTVDVAPRAANIVAFANGQRLRTTEKVKLGLQEGQRGVVLDGAATTPTGGRQLTNYTWEITGPEGFTATRQGTGIPGALRVILPDQGEYKIILTVFDNQNNQLSETFGLAISDPVALIKQTPEVGDSTTTYNFDGSISYSITSRIRLFTRDIFDGVGNRLDTFQGRTISRQFPRPGGYTIRLNVIDEEGQENSETRQILVESSAPVAQFLITPVADILYPSEFTLDAGVTIDRDVINGFDSLDYQREFSSPTTEILESQDNGKVIRIAFNEIGKHTVRLRVVDQFGKSNDITKEFDILSTLRPKIIPNPRTTARGSPVTFAVQTNKTVLGYERDFGGGAKRTVQNQVTSHIYPSVGVYTVTVKVHNGSEENEARTLIFIGEKDSPIPAYNVENPAINLTLIQNEVCSDDINGQMTDVPAYKVDRYQDVRINATDSVNVRGENSGLKMFFQPRNDQIFRDQGGVFTHRFNELGCQFINLTVEDETVGKISAVKIWFKVVNALPTLDNITLAYPQFGNASGIGFQEAAAVPQDIFNTDYDPLIVRVSAINPRDTDGSMSYFQRYYYEKNDPARILATKLSPGDVPHTFFSVPRMPGEFMFGVKVFDNDGGSQRSEDVIGNGPVVFFPPNTNRPDIPIVVLRVNKTSVDVGEEVTFDIISRVLSERPDFIQERVIQIDFDGDGERDITTKSDRVTYAYTQPSEEGFTPRASVVYRGYRGQAQGENIIVKNMLRPRLLFQAADKLLLVRDVSLGDIAGQKICMDSRECDDDIYVRTDRDEGFVFTYPDYGRYIINMDIFDQNANNATQRRPIEIKENTGALTMLSIPQADVINAIPEIFVGKNLNNSVLFYIKYNSPTGVCYVDIDITIDSNGEENLDQNKDFACNEIHLQAYTPSYQTTTGRVYYEHEGVIQTQDFLVSFLDFELTLDEKTREIYLLINELLQSIDMEEANNIFLVDQLIALKDSVLDKNDVKAILVSIQDTITTQDIVLSVSEKEKIALIIDILQDKSVSAALGGSQYEQAKAEILSILPSKLGQDVKVLFESFETAVGTEEKTLQDTQKEILQQIVTVIGNQVASNSDEIQNDQIDPADMEMIVLPNICAITEFYNIPTESCNYGTEGPVTQVPTDINDQLDSSKGLATRLKILFIVLGVLVGGFIGLVVLFAVKAKIRGESGDDNEEAEEYIVPQENNTPPAPQPTEDTTPPEQSPQQ